MTQIVTVISNQGNRAVVGYDRPTACHGDCDHCGGGCGSMAAKEHVTVCAENIIGAKPGDKVKIEADTRAVFSAILLVYALPMVLFFAGYFGAEVLGFWGTLIGVLGFFLGLLVAVLVSRKQTKIGREIRFRIVDYAE